MEKFEVVSPVKHDGVLYRIGEFIEGKLEHLEELLHIGSLQVASDTPPADPQARLEAVKAAIVQLDPANLDLWLKDGKPATEALAAVTAGPVSAAERDAAWDALQTATIAAAQG